MNSLYDDTSYIWPMLVSTALHIGLGIYCLRNRHLPGATQLAASEFLMSIWAIASTFQLTAVDLSTKIAWAKFESLWHFPAAVAAFWFAVEYANLGRRLNRRAWAILLFPLAITLFMMLTNDWLGLAWVGYTVRQGTVILERSSWGWILISYGILLSLATVLVFLRLFLHSPLHRWPLSLVLMGMITTRIAYLFDAAGVFPFAPMDATVLAQVFTSVMYVLALFRYHLFDILPLAQETLIAQMPDGMVVLDRQRRVVEINPAAARIFDVDPQRARDQFASQAFPVLFDDNKRFLAAFCIEKAGVDLRYSITMTPLSDPRGSQLGVLLILHDETERIRAQEERVRQQQAQASLEERQRLARDLHDSLGQVLGYVSFQADAARKLYQDGHSQEADRQLSRLSATMQEAHADVREFILNLRASPDLQQQLAPTLTQYLEHFSMQFEIQTFLLGAEILNTADLNPESRLHIFRIIQEAISNARRHAHARQIEVNIQTKANFLTITVADNGCGFNPSQLPAGNRCGLDFMRERAAQLGGRIQIHSEPGAGTRIELEIPLSRSLP